MDNNPVESEVPQLMRDTGERDSLLGLVDERQHRMHIALVAWYVIAGAAFFIYLVAVNLDRISNLFSRFGGS